MKEESSLGKLKRLIGESEEIRNGNLSGKKQEIASKMTRKSYTADKVEKYRKFLHTKKGRERMWKKDGVQDKNPHDFSSSSEHE